MKIKLINRSNNELPAYSSLLSAGMDLRASTEATITIEPGKRMLIPTGLYIELPAGYEAQVRPRSGLAINHGITVLNSPGTIDADYRGEVKVILINLSEKEFSINNGDRIAQIVIAKHESIEWDLTDSLESSSRGAGGFGSTGI